MDTSKEVVRLLEEEVVSLRSQGKRVAAESVEKVIAKFGRLDRLVEKLKEQPPERWTYPEDAAAAHSLSRLPGIRDAILAMQSDSFQVTSFHVSQFRIGEDGVSVEYSGRGEAKVLEASDGGRKRAEAELSAHLPAPLKGYRRVSLDLNTSFLCGAKPIIRFCFRDVQAGEGKA